MKNKEAIVEAFSRIVDSSDYVMFDYASFEEGAKWQQEQDKWNFTPDNVRDILKVLCVNRKKRSYSEDEAIEFFIEGYKQRAIASDLIFDNASRMYAIHLFKQFKNE